MKLFLIVAFLFAQPLAHAGQETHGGNVIVCEDADPQVLDYYYANLPSPIDPQPERENLDGLTSSQVVDLFSQKLHDTYFGEQFERVRSEIGDPRDWVAADSLKPVKDDGLSFEIPEGCNLVQGAIREGNSIYIERELVSKLIPLQLGMLVVHEILYKLAVEKGKETSGTTRQMVRSIILKSNTDELLKNSAHSLGWEFYYIEAFSGKFESLSGNPWHLASLEILNWNPVKKTFSVRGYSSIGGVEMQTIDLRMVNRNKFLTEDGGNPIESPYWSSYDYLSFSQNQVTHHRYTKKGEYWYDAIFIRNAGSH